MMKRYLIFALLLGSLVAKAQTSPLVLEDALQAVEGNAHVLKTLAKDASMAQEHLEASQQRFLPQIQLGYTGIYTNSPLNAFGFKLEQQVVQQSDFAPDLLNNPDGLTNFNTQIQIQQPLFNYDAKLAPQRWQKQLEAVGFQQQFALSKLQKEVKNAYVHLQLLYATQAVLGEADVTLQEHLKIVSDFMGQGLAKSTDQMGVQVKLQELASQKAVVSQNIAKVSSYISYLTGMETIEGFEPTSMIEEAMPTATLAGSISDNRADFQAYSKAIEAREVGLAMTNAQRLPRLNAFGAFNLNDESPVGFGGNNFMVGVKLSWQLHLGKQLSSQINSQQLAIDKASIELEDAKAQENMMLKQAMAEYQSLREQIGYAEASLTLAKEQLRVTQNRFKEGLEKSADILMANNQLSQTQLKIKQLYAQLKLSQNQIEFILAEK